ncbi:MAG: hypothetical protein KJ958_05010 [Gammaproteobacteria bacterium]|nr:hypothetical protein [Gammaproteobacteria bacterium]MBU1978514.1 hypothetical protein [Gammaproteobacteria bacterium]
MKSLPKPRFERLHMIKQRGVVLFFSLIALLVLSLAAVALIRSVDTSTLIAGNLAFKQSTTTSGDAGVEAAITWLTATQAANSALNVLNSTAHAFNNDNTAAGYYSSVHDNPLLPNNTANPAYLNLFADATWNVSTIPEITDSSGNKIRYIIQRMCRNANVTVQNADCLFSGATADKNGQNIPLPQDICTGAGCPAAGSNPQTRITARATGPKNTFSYVQAFVF